VMGKGVDALSQREYKVSGPMDDPVIEPLDTEAKGATEQGADPAKNRNAPPLFE